MGATALGVRKAAARRIGVTPEDYQRHLAAGEKWCTGCKAWHVRGDFGPDRSRPDGLRPFCRASWRRYREGRRRPFPERVRSLLPATVEALAFRLNTDQRAIEEALRALVAAGAAERAPADPSLFLSAGAIG